MLTEAQLKDALVNQLPMGAEIDRFFKVIDEKGRIRMGAYTSTSMNNDDQGWYAEVSNFQLDRGDYCDPCEHTKGLYRFFCEVDPSETDIDAYMSGSAQDAQQTLDRVCEPRS